MKVKYFLKQVKAKAKIILFDANGGNPFFYIKNQTGICRILNYKNFKKK